MPEHYESKYYLNLDSFLKYGWTKAEIDKYFPILENMDAENLLQLHEMCGIKMYSPGQWVNKEQAIHVLVSGYDTSKEALISAINKIENS